MKISKLLLALGLLAALSPRPAVAQSCSSFSASLEPTCNDHTPILHVQYSCAPQAGNFQTVYIVYRWGPTEYQVIHPQQLVTNVVPGVSEKSFLLWMPDGATITLVMQTGCNPENQFQVLGVPPNPLPPEQCGLPPDDKELELEFELSDVSNPTGVKMLVSKHGASDGYPQPNEQEPPDSLGRPRMKIRGSVREKTTGAAPTKSTEVYIRLRDPEDTAPYVVNEGLHEFGDNADKAATLSKIDGTTVNMWDCASKPGVACPAIGFLKLVLNPNQSDFEVILNGSAYAAGDNYQVEAALGQPATCMPPGCAKTATITMWKRVYVEELTSFRRGGRIAVDAVATPEKPVVDTVIVRVNPHTQTTFSEGQIVEFVHAPRLDGSGSPDFYADQRRVIVASSSSSEFVALTLDRPLDREYYASDPGALSDQTTGADGVGILAEGTNAPVDLIIMRDLMARAFVEVISTSGPAIPTLFPMLEVSAEEALVLGKKWFPDRNVANHFLVVSAGTISGAVGVVHPGFRRTIWIASEQLNSYWQLAHPERFTVAGEVVAHEMSHGWHVNPNPAVPASADSGGHCEYSRSDNPNKACVLQDSIFRRFRIPYSMKDNIPAPEFYDGETSYHAFVSGTVLDSEFMDIRHRPEPVPDN